MMTTEKVVTNTLNPNKGSALVALFTLAGKINASKRNEDCQKNLDEFLGRLQTETPNARAELLKTALEFYNNTTTSCYDKDYRFEDGVIYSRRSDYFWSKVIGGIQKQLPESYLEKIRFGLYHRYGKDEGTMKMLDAHLYNPSELTDLGGSEALSFMDGTKHTTAPSPALNKQFIELYGKLHLELAPKKVATPPVKVSTQPAEVKVAAPVNPNKGKALVALFTLAGKINASKSNEDCRQNLNEFLGFLQTESDAVKVHLLKTALEFYNNTTTSCYDKDYRFEDGVIYSRRSDYFWTKVIGGIQKQLPESYLEKIRFGLYHRYGKDEGTLRMLDAHLYNPSELTDLGESEALSFMDGTKHTTAPSPALNQQFIDLFGQLCSEMAPKKVAAPSEAFTHSAKANIVHKPLFESKALAPSAPVAVASTQVSQIKSEASNPLSPKVLVGGPGGPNCVEFVGGPGGPNFVEFVGGPGGPNFVELVGGPGGMNSTSSISAEHVETGEDGVKLGMTR